MPLLQNIVRLPVALPLAVESIPEEAAQPRVHAAGLNAAVAGNRNGRPMVPAVRQPPPAAARPQGGGNDGRENLAFDTHVDTTLHAVRAPAPPVLPAKPRAEAAAPKQARKHEPKHAPPAPSNGAKDRDFGAMSFKGGRGYRFSFKSLTWVDTAVKHVSLDPEAAIAETKLPWQGRPWYANLRPLAIPVVAAYILICIVYIVIRALKSVDAIASPAFGKVVLAFEVLGMVSLLQAGINHIYKVDWTTQPFMTARDPKYRVRVLVPCYKEDVDVLRKTLTRAARALHEGAACIAEAHIYLCDDAPKGAAAKKGGPTYRDERSRMMGLGSGDAPTSLRSIARGDASSTLHRKVTLHHQPRFKGDGTADEGLVNNKAKNINHCVERISKDWTSKCGSPFNEDGLEIFAILDADQAIVDKEQDKTELEEVVEPPLRPSKSLAFFKDLLPYFIPDPQVAIVQTPQVFKGCLLGTDILNHRNIDFWSHQQPAYNLRKFISCAGTNFLIRASAFVEAGGFPGHTLTEDFALGQQLMGLGYYGVYVEKAYVLGEAPDVLRTAVGQRSRWCKGAFQMLVSLRGLRSLAALRSPRLIWMYIFPCYNYLVSGLSTPLFMAIPVIYIFAGLFPALLTAEVIGVAAAYFIITLMVQYFPRFDRGRVLADLLAHWNADVATKNFWFMFIKSALRGPLPKCNEGVSRWKSGSDKESDGWRDVFPHIGFLLAYFISVIWAILQFSAGVAFKGPMGIALLWCFFQGIPPFLLVLHRCMKIRHEVKGKEDLKPAELRRAEAAWRLQHGVYTTINVSLMLASAALAVAILVIASMTAGSVKLGNDAVYSGKTSTGYLTPSELVRALKGEGLPMRFT